VYKNFSQNTSREEEIVWETNSRSEDNIKLHLKVVRENIDCINLAKVASSGWLCKHDNEPSVSTKCEEFLKKHLLKEARNIWR
jgi:hypothetical protein